MNDMKTTLAALILLSLPALALDRPKLQITNGGTNAIEVFWIGEDGKRVSNGTVEPGKNTIIGTTIGHRFVIVDGTKEREVVSKVRVQGFRYDPDLAASADGVPAFYTQRVSAGGFPIVASAKVSQYALKEAAYLIDMMLAKRPDVREAMVASGARLCILAHNEFTMDQPEFQRLGPVKGFEALPARDYWDARARGLGGSETDPFCTCGEENLLAYPGDPYETENILIHEFAHNLHLRGLINVDPTFDKRLKASFDAAMKAGLWKGVYASSNHHEYWAEGVQSWFDNNRENDHDHNHVNTRAELVAYDAGMAALCREVFGDTELKYTKPQTRLTGHLAGYDPAKAPRFVWPERLMQARGLIKKKQTERFQAATGKKPQGDRILSGWTVHVSTRLIAEQSAEVEKALQLMQAQMDEIVKKVPAAALAELRKVPLWVSPEYPKTPPRAEYHPNAGWLRDNGRDPQMAKGVEFTNVRIFEAECRRMPNFTLHELAHAYHDRVLGYEHAEIQVVFEKAQAGGKYERVQRQDSEGRKRLDRAYAMTNAKEYFAECTEAYFSSNDFYPFNREELQKHDPEMFALLGKVWGEEASSAGR